MATETALEIDTEAAGYTRSEPVHFGSFPGLWAPGEPIAVSELGFPSEQDALDRVAELELPLRQVTVDLGSASMPERPNHLLSQEQQRALDLDAAKDWPPRTHAAADQVATAAGVSFPAGTKTVADKVAFLEQARDGLTNEAGEQTGPPAEGDG